MESESNVWKQQNLLLWIRTKIARFRLSELKMLKLMRLTRDLMENKHEKNFPVFFWKTLDKHQNLWYNKGTSRGTTKQKEILKMENMNRLNRMTVTEEQLKLLYKACVREKSRWCGMAQ